VVSAYGKLLRPRVFELPPHGCLNTHASLLPKYRGAAPINWAIINGETEAGVTIMRIDKGVDTGAMSLRRAIPIEPTDTAATLTDKLAKVGGELIVEALRALEVGTLSFTPQDDSAATHAPMMTKDHGRVDWTKSADELDRLIRGVTPWPGAQTTLGGDGVKILEATPTEEASGEPGAVIRADKKGIVIGCGKGALVVKRLQMQGRNPVDAAAFLNGRALTPGDRFGT
ncbi:methionyl-tRNA formyltransferase, partial [bacterium]|nr:methionyl-tRNA formyltransferase [bacterium]